MKDEIKNNREHSKAIILLIITAVLWSMGGLLIKLITWNPIAISGMRCFIALLMILAINGKNRISISLPKIGGAISYAGMVILFVTANKLTASANVIFLQYTAPVYVALLGVWLLKEKVAVFDWCIIAFTLLGMALFFMDELDSGKMLGNILAVLGGICFALFALFLRMQKSESSMDSLLLGNILTIVISLPFIFQTVPDIKSILALLASGIFQFGLPYILYTKAVKNVTALEAVLIPSIEPILNPLWVFFFLGETPGMWALIGGLIVLITVTLRCVVSTKSIKNIEISSSQNC